MCEYGHRSMYIIGPLNEKLCISLDASTLSSNHKMDTLSHKMKSLDL
jgi:hypothetical protein